MALEEDFDFTPTPFIEMEGLEETKTGLEVGVEEEAGLNFKPGVTLVPSPSTMNVLVALLPSPTIVAALLTPPQKEERPQKRRRTKDTKPPPIWGSVTMSEDSGGFFGVSLDIESDLERRILESKKLEQEEEQLRRQYEEQKK